MLPNRFSTIRPPESTSKLAEWDHDVTDLEEVVCPLDEGHRRAGRRLSELSVTLPRGFVPDIVWTWQSECLIRDSVLRLFRREAFSGFDIKPVRVRFKSGRGEPPALWELVLTGWGGIARPESGIKRTYFCEACKHVQYSGLVNSEYLFDETQWDGSDFFMVWPMPRFILITQRVANCILDHRLSGAVIKHVQELSGVGKDGFSCGRLSYWMPESRARLLGETCKIAEI
jgi:hypothetical protein